MLHSLAALDSVLYAGSPARAQLDSLASLLRARVETIERVLAARDGGFAVARSAWLESGGPLQSAAIERVISEMRTAEGAAERQAASAVREGIRRALTFVVLGTLLGFVVLGVAAAAMRRAWRNLEDTRDRLAVALAAEERSLANSLVELQAQEEQYRLLVESLPQMIWTVGPEGQSRFVSPQYEAYTGSAVQTEGDARWDQIHPADRQRFIEAWESAMTTGSPLREKLRLQGHDGSYRWFETRAVPQRDASVPALICCVAPTIGNRSRPSWARSARPGNAQLH